jgi:glycosyltransferase involved in cell wall biosynthesis
MEEAAQKIKLILQDTQLQQRLSQNARKLAKSFNLKKCARILNQVYESIL